MISCCDVADGGGGWSVGSLLPTIWNQNALQAIKVLRFFGQGKKRVHGLGRFLPRRNTCSAAEKPSRRRCLAPSSRVCLRALRGPSGQQPLLKLAAQARSQAAFSAPHRFSRRQQRGGDGGPKERNRLRRHQAAYPSLARAGCSGEWWHRSRCQWRQSTGSDKAQGLKTAERPIRCA